MTLEQLLPRLIPALERAHLTYMITGSVASSAHGAPRSTRDLDIVIAPTREQILALLEQFPNSHYYADEEQAGANQQESVQHYRLCYGLEGRFHHC